MKKLAIVTLSSLAPSALGSAATAQSDAYLLPHGMSAGMSVLNMATRPKPAAAHTPGAPGAIPIVLKPVTGGWFASIGPGIAG
jgi:hypothetical protein